MDFFITNFNFRRKALEPKSSKKSLSDSVNFSELASRTRERFRKSGLGIQKMQQVIPEFENENFVMENLVTKARW